MHLGLYLGESHGRGFFSLLSSKHERSHQLAGIGTQWSDHKGQVESWEVEEVGVCVCVCVSTNSLLHSNSHKIKICTHAHTHTRMHAQHET